MRFVADLHIHSYLSRATSKDLNLEQLHRWAQLKGISIVGTGDFTHPRWLGELREKLVPVDGGLFALRPDLASAADGLVPGACRAPVRFLLSVEISSIYKRGEKVRKVHNLAYVPDFESAARIATRLARIGNIESDGRPILGVDSRDLLEIVLESSPDAFLIPAHIWTPWFSALGAQSGFDDLEECYRDLTSHLFAVETGLSSDPAMNWRLSKLDRLALVSNSDAHSPEKLGREASVFDCELSYFALRNALRERREDFLGTIEFFPEEGKYHFDGHRKCGVVLAPEEARAAAGICRSCGKRLTEGVMNRVVQLADREEGVRPDGAKPFRSLVPLPEVIGEVVDTGPESARVRRAYQRLLERVGPELKLLTEMPLEAFDQEGPPLLSEAIRRMRIGEVHLQPGFDGEYGVVRAFDEEERRRLLAQKTFSFAVPSARQEQASPSAVASPVLFDHFPTEAPGDELNAEQLAALEHGDGPLLIVAGPGTGKTRTVVYRIANLVRTRRVPPRSITAITFTRKAAQELKDRLKATLGGEGQDVNATTFHAFGLDLLREFAEQAGLPRHFQVLDEVKRLQAVEDVARRTPGYERQTARLAEQISSIKCCFDPNVQGATAAPAGESVANAYAEYQRKLAELGAVDFDDLVLRAVALLKASDEALAKVRQQARYLFVDEYQDINPAQYSLVRLLAPAHRSTNLCAVGDPDQSIYGFRGSDPSYFRRFSNDYPNASQVTLVRNYRSSSSILRAAAHVIDQSPGRSPRRLEATHSAPLKIERFVGANEAQEADFIAAEIERAVGGTSLYSVDSGRASPSEEGLAFHDLAVLFRLSAQGEAIEESLGRAGIPFHRVRDDSLMARPFFRQLIDSLPLSVSDGQRPVAERIERLYPQDQGDPRRRRAVDLLATLAIPFGRDLEAFLSAVAAMRDTDLTLEPQKVALLTLHASKGLEFPLVFIAGCEGGLLPLSLPWLPRADVEEERRLLYVGMTRAKQRLVLTSARQRILLGRTMESGASPFLRDLPSELCTEVREPIRSKRLRQLSLL